MLSRIKEFSNKYKLSYLLNLGGISAIFLLLFIGLYSLRDLAMKEEQAMGETPGYKLVKCLYEFENVSDLNSERDNQLKELVTDNVYDELTFDNEGRMLRTYLKLKSDPVKVIIVRDVEGLVLYRLETEKINTDRLFALVYETDKIGKISYVREMECIDFVTTID